MKQFVFKGTDGCKLTAWKIGTTGNHLTVLLHGGGPDHKSLVPLAQKISDLSEVVIPDIRGYGRSVCMDSSKHTWKQYVEDVISMLDFLKVEKAVVGGTGLGATLSLRFAAVYPERAKAIIPISIEDIEDDEAKKVEIEFMDAFADRVRSQGIMAGWGPILDSLAPVIRNLVEEAIPRSTAESISAAAAIGHDRAFKSVDELKEIGVPALIIPGMDYRHPTWLAEKIAEMLPNGRMAGVKMEPTMKTSDDLARVFAPVIREFIRELKLPPG